MYLEIIVVVIMLAIDEDSREKLKVSLAFVCEWIIQIMMLMMYENGIEISINIVCAI